MATEDVDYYALLGIEQTATSAEIRKAYRQKSLKVHPDRNPDDPQAAALFHELSIAADTLSDPTKRASFDALLTARNARKQRFAALDNKRRALAEDLELREREFKKQKAGEATEATSRKQELERLKEEGRRMREMRASQANAGVEAQRRAEEAERAAAAEAQRRRDPAATMNGPAGVVELGPLDKTLKVKWLKSVHPALDSPAAVSTFFRTALAPLDPDIDSAVLSSKTLANPSKGKFGSGVVAFKSLSAANRAIKGKQADPEGLWKGFEVDWAAGSPPAALGGDAGRAPTSAAGSNGAAQSPASAPLSAPAAAVPKPPPAASDEDAILAKLRQRERERERLMEEMRRQDEEEASGGAYRTRIMATQPAPTLLPPPNPYLTKPELYISGLPGDVEDGEIVQVLRDCLRLRLKLDRDPLNPSAPLTGVVEFETLDRAERAYATCKLQRIGNHPGSLILSFSPDPASDPRPLAQTLILKQLPKPFTPSELFDLVRPFGPVFSAVLLFAPSRDGLGSPVFKGQALVTFYEERYATEARNALHFLEVQGQTIAVQVYDPNRAGLKLKARVSGPPPRQHSSSENEPVAPPTTSRGSMNRAAESETPPPVRQAGPSLGLSSASGMSGPSTTSAARAQPRKVSKWAPTPPEDSSGALMQEEAGGSKAKAEVSALESAMTKLTTGPDRSPPNLGRASSAIAYEPTVQVKSERDRLAEGIAEHVHGADIREEVLDLVLGLPKKERAKCLFNPDVLKLKVHDAVAVLEADKEETSKIPSVALGHTAGGRSETELTAPILASQPTKLLPESLVDLATWSCADTVSILPALIPRFSLPVPPRAEIEESRTFMKALEGKPVGVIKQKLGERLFKVVKEMAKEQGLKGAPRITIELLDTEDLSALAELVLYPAILREKVISVGERLSIG